MLKKDLTIKLEKDVISLAGEIKQSEKKMLDIIAKKECLVLLTDL